jgi:hypothetical protein
MVSLCARWHSSVYDQSQSTHHAHLRYGMGATPEETPQARECALVSPCSNALEGLKVSVFQIHPVPTCLTSRRRSPVFVACIWAACTTELYAVEGLGGNKGHVLCTMQPSPHPCSCPSPPFICPWFALAVAMVNITQHISSIDASQLPQPLSPKPAIAAL